MNFNNSHSENKLPFSYSDRSVVFIQSLLNDNEMPDNYSNKLMVLLDKLGCAIFVLPGFRVLLIHIRCGQVVRDFEREAKTRCNFQFR